MREDPHRYYNLKDLYYYLLIDQRTIDNWELYQNHFCVEFTIPKGIKGPCLLNAAFQPRLEDEFC
jgi:hypothetical protein